MLTIFLNEYAEIASALDGGIALGFGVALSTATIFFSVRTTEVHCVTTEASNYL